MVLLFVLDDRSKTTGNRKCSRIREMSLAESARHRLGAKRQDSDECENEQVRHLNPSIGLIAVGRVLAWRDGPGCYVSNRTSLAEPAMVGADFSAIMGNRALADGFHRFARSKRNRAIDHHRCGRMKLFRGHELRFAQGLGTPGRERHHPEADDHIGFECKTLEIEEHLVWRLPHGGPFTCVDLQRSRYPPRSSQSIIPRAAARPVAKQAVRR